MTDQMNITVVLPAYNEEKNLPVLIPQIAQVLSDFGPASRIVVVNDCSRDKTGEVATQLAQQYPMVDVVHHKINRGYGGAVRSGFARALTLGTEWVFFTDSDNQFDITELHLLANTARVSGDPMVIGYRRHRADPFQRKLNGWGWTLVSCLTWQFFCWDVDCAFKLMQARVLRDVGELSGEGATINPELLGKATKIGYRFTQVPVTHLPRTEGTQTGAKIHVIINSFRSLFKGRLEYSRRARTRQMGNTVAEYGD